MFIVTVIAAIPARLVRRACRAAAARPALPIIAHVVAAARAGAIDEVLVATDHDARTPAAAGADVVMTDPAKRLCSDRIGAALAVEGMSWR